MGIVRAVWVVGILGTVHLGAAGPARALSVPVSHCLMTCGDAIARCTAQGFRQRFCAREILRLCKRGASLCDTTTPDGPPTCVTTTTVSVSTSTTLAGECPVDGVPDPDAASVVPAPFEGSVYSRLGIGTAGGQPELDVIGIYESATNRGIDQHPVGEASVEVTRAGPLTLVLSSYEPTHWTVTVAPGSVLSRVILNGFYPQTATVPSGVPVDNRSPYGAWLGSYGYAWPDNGEGGSTANLIARSEAQTGTCLSAFYGAYGADQFVLGPPPTSTGSWTASNFRSAASVVTPCQGARYVKYLPAYDKWVGVSLCSAKRYKIFLATDPSATFYEIGDYAGNGQDHCELVNPTFRIPNEDEITSGGCTGCSIDNTHVFSPPVGSTGWSRARFGEQFQLEASWPQYNLYTAQWYECGVSVP